MKKIYYSIALFAFAISANAESLTVRHTTPCSEQNESSLLSEIQAAAAEQNISDLTTVTDLKITGVKGTEETEGDPELTIYDLIVLRTNKDGYFKNLKKIDLSEAVFKSGLPHSQDAWDNMGAFTNMTQLEEVVLPENDDSFIRIGAAAFKGCTNLKSVNIPATVTIIEMYAFQDCENLQMQELPRDLNTIYASAFKNCPNVTFSTFPAGLESIGDEAFNDAKNVTFSSWPEAIVSLGAENNPAYKIFRNTKVAFSTWPLETTEIYKTMFVLCDGITDFTIPETIEKIGNQAFYITNTGVKRTFTCRRVTPPAAATDNNDYTGAFGVAAVLPNTTMMVKNEALETYKATSPYSQMNIVPLTTNINVSIAGEGSVSTELGEATEGVMPIYEGNSTITFTPAEGYDVVSVKYGETELIENMVDNTLVFDCPQTPETLSVEFSISSSVNALENAQVKVYPNPTTDILHIENNEGVATLYDLAGQKVAATDDNVIDVSNLNAGVYILKTKEASFKVVKQ